MKGLLQSSRFKKNLLKWIFMYIVVMGSLFAVITYSKYISNMQSRDRGKVASFDASITYGDVCQNVEANTLCNVGYFRPTSDINIYFNIDNRKIETSALFVTNIELVGDLVLKEIWNQTDNKKLILGTDYTISNNKITITESLKSTEMYSRDYKLVVNYNIEKDPTYIGNHNIKVMVGYSATQID